MAKSLVSPATDLDQGEDAPRTVGGRPHPTKRTVHLASGGTLTLDLEGINLLALNTTDRNFLFTVVDTLEAYARTASESPSPAT